MMRINLMEHNVTSERAILLTNFWFPVESYALKLSGGSRYSKWLSESEEVDSKTQHALLQNKYFLVLHPAIFLCIPERISQRFQRRSTHL